MTFQRVASLDDLDDGVPEQVKVDGHPLCLVRLGDEVRAIYDVCSHEEYPLHEGFTWDRSIECALHGSMFDLDSGEAQGLPATRPVPVYATRIDRHDVLVDLDEQLNDAPVPEH